MPINERIKEIEKLNKKITELEENERYQEADELLLELRNCHLDWMLNTIHEQQNKLDRFTKSIAKIIEEDTETEDELPIRPEVSI